MRMYKVMRCLRCVAAGSSLLLLSPYTAAADAATDHYVLRVRPSICVSYNQDEPCRMDMELSWQGPPKPELCLHELLRDPLLQCWRNAALGNFGMEFAGTEDSRYQLREGANGMMLAETFVKVINRDLRTARKRRRHVWSIL